MEVYKPQENMEQLRKVAKEVNDYLEPILDEAFNLKLRTEYTDNNLNEWMRGMREVNDREKNLGVTDDVSEEKFFSTLNEFGETAEIIDGLKPLEHPLDMNQMASMASHIRELDKTGALSKNIKNIYGEDEDTWIGFIDTLNDILRNLPRYWDYLRKRSETPGYNKNYIGQEEV